MGNLNFGLMNIDKVLFSAKFDFSLFKRMSCGIRVVYRVGTNIEHDLIGSLSADRKQ
jgi:hypothetical protein